jgi:FtsP/CotA-like multicopper oxidase with cupredoxin domain
VITRRGEAKPDGSPKDVDREVIAYFAEIDENTSLYYGQNMNAYLGDPSSIPKVITFADAFYIANLKETINGLVFGNMPMITMKQGEHVRWYIFANTNFEMHAPHWHGNTVVAMNMRTDVLPLLPMGMIVADMVPDNPGTWLFHCHVAGHFEAGMVTRYRVETAQ